MYILLFKRFSFLLVLISFIFSLELKADAILPNIDLAGSDYRNFTSYKNQNVTSQICKAVCKRETACKSWTFVKPNTFQGPKGRCWLKRAIPRKIPNRNCISGIK